MSDISIQGPERQADITLRDGRKLAWSEWGPESGKCVLFCTGAGMSGSLGLGVDVVHDLGLRLVGIDRPGLGRSDPDPSKSFLTWTADIAELIHQLDLNRPASLGFSQGAPFALALAHAGLVKAVAIVSGQDEPSHRRFNGMLDPGVDGLRQQVEEDPIGAERHIAETATSEWLWSMISQMSSEADRTIYNAEPFATHYRQALEEGFVQGAAGYARDLILALSPWPFALSEIDVPVHLWYGAKDTSPVHSPDFGASAADSFPRSARTLIDSHGSAVLWLHARSILERLLRS
jgi:pimeloyl-ACP methyl ester carboxylesterase